MALNLCVRSVSKGVESFHHFEVVHGFVLGGKDCSNVLAIETEEELRVGFLLDPVVHIVRLHVRGTLSQILNRNPQPPSDGLLRNRPESMRFTPYTKGLQVIEGDVLHRDQLVCTMPGKLIDLLRYFSKGDDIRHGYGPPLTGMGLLGGFLTLNGFESRDSMITRGIYGGYGGFSCFFMNFHFTKIAISYIGLS